MTESSQSDVTTFAQLESVNTILQVLRRATGLRIALVARVTEDSWTVLDDANFGLNPGEALALQTTY